MIHCSATTYHEDETGWFKAECGCGWSEAPFPDLDATIDALMQHARERALIDDLDAVLEQVGWMTPSMADGPNIGGLVDGKRDHRDEPVYRRRPIPVGPT